MSESDLGMFVYLIVGYGGFLWLAVRMRAAKKANDAKAKRPIRVWTIDGYKEYAIIDGDLVCIRDVTGQ